jgi:hypothetical protein
MQCPKCSSSVFWCQRWFSSHFAQCQGSLHGRTSSHNCPPPTHQQVAAAVNNASGSSTVHAAAADLTNEVLFNTTTSSCFDRRASAESAAVSSQVDSSYLSLKGEGTSSQPIESTMDIDVSCFHYSYDLMPKACLLKR